MRPFHLFAGLLALFALSLAAAACGGDNDDDESSADPVVGGTLTIASLQTSGPFTTLSPVGSYVAGSEQVGLYLNGLYALDADGNPDERLATGWDVSDDNLTYTFTLREGVSWHDGQPFSSEDVKFSLELYRNPEVLSWPQASMLSLPIKSVEAPDPHTVRVLLSTVYAPFLKAMSEDAGFFVVPKHLLEGVSAEDLAIGEYSQAPVGTGPFKVVEFRQNEFATLERNEDYFRGEPLLERIIIRFPADSTSLYAQLRAGEVQFGPITTRQAADLGESGSLRLHRFTGAGCKYLVYNLTVAPFDDADVRKAVSHAIDRDAIVDSVFSGFATPSYGLLAPSSYDSLADTKPFAYDLAEVERIMTAAGYSRSGDTWQHDGKPISVNLGYFEGSIVDADLAAVMATSLKEAGFESESRAWEISAWFAEATQLPSFLYNAGARFDPDDVYLIFHGSQLLGQGAGFNFMGKASPVIDAALDTGRSTLDDDGRRAAYRQFDEATVADPPGTALYCADVTYAGAANLAGPGELGHAGGYAQTTSTHMYREVEKWGFTQ